MKTQFEDVRGVEQDPERLKSRQFEDYRKAADRIGVAALGTSKGFHGNIFEPEFLVHQLANAFMVQLFDTSAVPPGDLLDKVLAYQEEFKALLTGKLTEAMLLERQRIGMVLEAHGHSGAAALIRR